MIQARKTFGQRGAFPAQAEGEVLKLKRSHMVVIAAAGLVAVATGFALSWPEAPAVQERTAAEAASGSSQQSTSSRIPLIIPVPIPSVNSAATPGMTQSSAQNTVQRGGFGETARGMSSSSGHVSGAS
jgi:hypothetical protein